MVFMGGYLAFSYLTHLLAPRSRLGSIVTGKFAWACLVLFPAAVFYEIVFVEEASYNAFLRDNFSSIFAVGALGVLLLWFEVFL